MRPRSREHPRADASGAMTALSLRSLRWRLAALYAAVSALGLLALGVFLVAAEGRLRSSALDSDLRSQAAQGVRLLWHNDDNVLQLESIRWDEELRAGYPQLYVVRKVGTRGDGEPRLKTVMRPRTPWYEGAPLRDAALGAIGGGGESIVRAEIWDEGFPVRLLAVPFLDSKNNVAGAIVTVGEEESLIATRNRLIVYVALGGLGLLALSSLAGYLLAGRSIRPAMQALAQQERFLADAAHEIRTPVAAIRALAEGAAVGDQPADAALQRTGEIAAHASRTVDDLLLLARADAGRQPLRREPLRLDLLVDAVLEDVVGVELEAEPVVVDGDPALLRRAVANLIDNAVRHGRSLDPAAPISVVVSASGVTVLDGGPGLEPGMDGKLFERFASGRRSGGTGLGLPLARWVARTHGGDVTARNREGGGAELSLTLPGARAAGVGGPRKAEDTVRQP